MGLQRFGVKFLCSFLSSRMFFLAILAPLLYTIILISESFYLVLFLFSPPGWHEDVYVYAEDSYTTPQVGLCDFSITINCNIFKLKYSIFKLTCIS